MTRQLTNYSLCYIILTFLEKMDYSIKNHWIILINFQIIHTRSYFAYHFLYRIQMFSSESDILIRRIPINRIWILKNGFGDRFGTELSYPFTSLSLSLPRGHPNWIQRRARQILRRQMGWLTSDLGILCLSGNCWIFLFGVVT
jgi:hypothetical protein